MHSMSFRSLSLAAILPVLIAAGGSTGRVFSPTTRSAALPLDPSKVDSFLVQVRGGGPKPTKKVSNAKTAPANCVIPAFLKTQASLQMLGCTMLMVGLPQLFAPEWLHSKLFLPDNNDMGSIYQELTGMREVLIGVMSLLSARKGTEELRRYVAVVVALILCPLQLRMLLNSKDVFVENIVGVMTFSQVFYAIYLPLTAYLSWQREKK